MKDRSQDESKEDLPIMLRRAGEADIPLLLELEKKVSGMKTYSYLKDEEEAREELASSVVYVIEKEGVPAEDASYEIKSPEHAYISGLVVIPEFQGQGIARTVLQGIMEELDGYSRVDLVTHPENARAISLYESFGFMLESHKENYFGDGEPRVTLARIKK